MYFMQTTLKVETATFRRLLISQQEGNYQRPLRWVEQRLHTMRHIGSTSGLEP